MFGIGKKDSDGRQVRIEHRGKHLRASRTGGMSLRGQAEAAGMTFTVNSKHGTRVSRRVAKGTNLALQSGRFRLRGRYGKGATKLNLSKSGASVSTKNKLGTFNWTNPNRSSAKVAGVQVRGKRAAQIQTVYLIATGIISFIQFTLMALVWLLRALVILLEFVGRLVVEVSVRAWSITRSGIRRLADRHARRKRDRRLATLSGDGAPALAGGSAPALPQADLFSFAVLLLGRGLGKEEPGEHERSIIINVLRDTSSRGTGVADDRIHERGNPGARENGSGEGAADDEAGARRPQHDALERVAGVLRKYDPETAMAALADRYAKTADNTRILDTFFRLDDLCGRTGNRTQRQDELLDIYCERTGVDLEPATTDS
ncbi:MAG: hypothetical protein ACLFM0_09780 [Spirochaetales bacterium]